MHKGDVGERPTETRLKQCQESSIAPPFVNLEAGHYLWDIFRDSGPVKAYPMGGPAALEWADLAAYATLTHSNLLPGESKLIIEMSEAYLMGLSEGSSPFSIAPTDRPKAV